LEPPSASSASFGNAARLSLRIAPVKLELSPKQIIETTGYNGGAPGPLLRVKEGQRVTVDVQNDSDVDELVHWHGLYVPSEVDGAMEEGTPMIPAGGARQYAFTAQPSGFNRWTINGKSWPDVDSLMVKEGRRYRITMENRSGDDHPMHFHRHTFELIRMAGKPTAGILKDTVNVQRRQSVEIDLVADDPGLTLYHCHMQLHMDSGFMALMKYA
jgi:FtsP/CotA-like multicopper oxidase with cupredoxin domain